MEMKQHAETLTTLNDISGTWSAQFEHKPKLTAEFSADNAGRLSFNGEPLCLITQVDPDTIFIDVESFGFRTKSGAEYRMYINWPFKGKPQVHRVSYDFPGCKIAN